MSDLESATGLPRWHPTRDVLELAELVLSGAIDLAALPFAIAIPSEVADAGGVVDEFVVIEDAEGTPVAIARQADHGAVTELTGLRPFSHGPVRSARRRPDDVRAELATLEQQLAEPHGVLAVLITNPLNARQVDAVLARIAESGQLILWLAVFGSGRASSVPPAALWRAVRDLAKQTTPDGGRSVAVPIAIPSVAPSVPAPELGQDDAQLLAAVARGYGATEILFPADLADLADPADPADLATAGEERDRQQPPHQRGLTIFFTGLSGSGKSTVAKAFADRLEEQSNRTFSLLDGDEVRRLLSAGLGFSRADRDLNIRRIGFVATEVTKHGGLAICAPIAPFAQARDEVRKAVEEVGDFVLIHISTPLEECERRDRKGLYAKARQGLIPDFTGISSPYEVPIDADLRLDTSQLDVQAAVDLVWELISEKSHHQLK